MPQLLVRDIEASVVGALRRRAAEQGVSVEEAHRRLLRASLLGDLPGPQDDFVAFLRSVPTDDSIPFGRSSDAPREIVL